MKKLSTSFNRHLLVIGIILSGYLLPAQEKLDVLVDSTGFAIFEMNHMETGTLTFTLFDDGTFSQAVDPKHQYDTSTTGYTAKTYFFERYEDDDPEDDEELTGRTGAGTTINPKIDMDGHSVIVQQSNRLSSRNIVYFMISVTNDCSSEPTNDTLVFHFDGKLEVVSGGILDDYGDWFVEYRRLNSLEKNCDYKYQWVVPDLKPNEIRTVYLKMQLRSTAKLGDKIVRKATFSACGNKEESKSSGSVVYRSPHDPNSKIVLPRCLALNYPIPQYQEIMVSSFNDGDTVAVNIQVDDEIPFELDPETFQMLESSHPSHVVIDPSNPRKFKVLFDTINLPGIGQTLPAHYSFDQCTFSYRYRACTFPNLPNTGISYMPAHIFFDRLAPVSTNNDWVTVSGECIEVECNSQYRSGGVPIKEGSMNQGWQAEVFPTLIDDQINLLFAHDDVRLNMVSVDLIGLMGRKRPLLQEILPKGNYQKSFDLSDLSPGVYILRLRIGETYRNWTVIKQ